MHCSPCCDCYGARHLPCCVCNCHLPPLLPSPAPFLLSPGRFLEGDFDEYVSDMRKPYVWGGEPELLMMSHVLK